MSGPKEDVVHLKREEKYRSFRATASKAAKGVKKSVKKWKGKVAGATSGGHQPLNTSTTATPPRWNGQNPSNRHCFNGPQTPKTPLDESRPIAVVTPNSQVRLITGRMAKLTARSLIAQMSSPRLHKKKSIA